MASIASPSSAGSDRRPPGSRAPRLRLVPDYVTSAGAEAIELAATAGLHLDPWQRDTLTDALGEDAEGRWTAFEVGTVVARQNGKGSIQEARELAGAILFGEKLIIHSAHEQATASEHFLRLLALIEESGFSSRMMKPVRGKGSEAIRFHDGTRIFFKTRTSGGGRGLTGDLVVFDEAMILTEGTTGALVPVMAARSIDGNPQLWYAGSAVDQQKHEHGVVLARLRDRAIKQIPRIAYFEWSVDGDDPDQLPDEVRSNPKAWAQANPGLGIRISHDHIANEGAGALGPREFAVERLGVGDWPDLEAPSSEAVLSIDAWRDCTDPTSQMAGAVCFAYDVRPDRSASAIVAAGLRPDGARHVEVIEHRRGTGWVAERIFNLTNAHQHVGVLYAGKSPAAALTAQLAEYGIEPRPVSTPEHAEACGQLVDAVEEQAVWHLGTDELEAAVEGAVKRPFGDSWTWSRTSSSADISPLVAGTLALWGVAALKPEPSSAWSC